MYRSLITVYDVKLRIERIIASVDRGDQKSRMATADGSKTITTVQSYVKVYAIRLFLEKVYQLSILFKSTSVYFPILIAL